MQTLRVSVSDLYSDVYFDIRVKRVSEDSIKHALESSYKKWSSKLTKTMGGHIRVCTNKRCIASGIILWWWNGTHTIRLDIESISPATMSQDARGGTSVCHEDYPRKEQSQPTCCAFVLSSLP